MEGEEIPLRIAEDLECIATRSAVLELERLERGVLAIEPHRKVEPVRLAAGVHHLDGFELHVLELEPAESRHLLVEAAAAKVAIASLGRPIMDRLVACNPLAAGVADEECRHGAELPGRMSGSQILPCQRVARQRAHSREQRNGAGLCWGLSWWTARLQRTFAVDIDTDKIDEATLALLYLGLHERWIPTPTTDGRRHLPRPPL